MRKVLSFLFAVIMIFSVTSVFACAEDSYVVISESIEYLEDGSYIVSTLVVENDKPVARATNSKTGSRTSVLYNSDNEPMVTLKLTATFNYTGSSATCTAASTSYTIHNSYWKVTSATATKSGNKATGNYTSKKYLLGIATQTINSTITITCSNTGTLS